MEGAFAFVVAVFGFFASIAICIGLGAVFGPALITFGDRLKLAADRACGFQHRD